MNPQSQQQTKPQDVVAGPMMPQRITAVRFVQAVSFAGTVESVSADVGGLAAIHKGVTIEPAYLSAGKAIVCKDGERADGVRLSRNAGGRVEASFVPMGNILEVRFGE